MIKQTIKLICTAVLLFLGYSGQTQVTLPCTNGQAAELTQAQRNQLAKKIHKSAPLVFEGTLINEDITGLVKDYGDLYSINISKIYRGLEDLEFGTNKIYLEYFIGNDVYILPNTNLLIFAKLSEKEVDTLFNGNFVKDTVIEILDVSVSHTKSSIGLNLESKEQILDTLKESIDTEGGVNSQKHHSYTESANEKRENQDSIQIIRDSIDQLKQQRHKQLKEQGEKVYWNRIDSLEKTYQKQLKERKTNNR